MKRILKNLLIACLLLSLNCSYAVAAVMPEPVQKEQTAAQKRREKDKRKREAAKAKAAKQRQKAAAQRKKETEKKKAKAAKAKAKRTQEIEKRKQAQAQKVAEQKAREEKQLREWEEYQANLANPKPEVISYFNIGARLGYAAMMDKINGTYMGAGTTNQSNVYQQLKGGPGAGLNVTYNLEYNHFLFETGLDFRFLNSTSAYGFQAARQDQTYGATYSYWFDNLAETRNMMQIGLPVMFGAQFSRYYFLVGAKVGYSLWSNYSQRGKYDIVVNDPALLEPYGMGIYNLNGQTNTPIKFIQPDINLAAEIGIDLDEWLQAQPVKKKGRSKIKPGQRLPFGRQHIHYRVGLFAEYGLLNTNATPKANPVEFNTNNIEVQRTNTLLAFNGDTKLNNLLVGAKFTVQFEVPGRKERPMAPPPSYAIYTVVDSETKEPLQVAWVETRNSENGKMAMRQKKITPKGYRQRHNIGTFIAEASADGYYMTSKVFDIEEVGSTTYVTIDLDRRPVFYVYVTSAETGMPVPSTIYIHEQNNEQPAFTLTTDSIVGEASCLLEDKINYTLHIKQVGYEQLDTVIANIGDTMDLALIPIKKGETFTVHHLHFATNKTRILPSSEAALNDLYMYLERNPEVRIKIIGHTDSVGRRKANQRLSEGRANAVRDELIDRGIAPDRIEAEGRGKDEPIDTNDTEEGRQNNRRVKIEIL